MCEVSTDTIGCSRTKHICRLFGSWLSNPQNRTETRGKTFPQNFISSRVGPEKVQKQGMMR